MHWIYLIHKFHNLSWITEINELFHDILIYWDAPVCMYTVGIYYVHIHAHAFSIYLENMCTIIHLCESDVTCGQVWWPKLEISAHTQQWTHTHPEQWAAIYAAVPGSSLGLGALLKGTEVMVLRVEKVLDIHSPHLQFLPDLRLKLATFCLRVRLSNY